MKRQLLAHPVPQAYQGGGAISMELSPKPFTITALTLVLRPDITTTTATNFNDYWDRIIQRLNLTGAGRTYFDITSMRALYHLGRFMRAAPPRPTVIANSQTNDVTRQILVHIHFGIQPWKINPNTGNLEYNPWDLSAGIPPQGSGNLTLGGTFAPAAGSLGTNVTVNDCPMVVYVYGCLPEAGDPDSAYLPKAYPAWQMQSPTIDATSGAYTQAFAIPQGDWLHSMLTMTTRGTNAPRESDVLNSYELFNQMENRSVFKYGIGLGTAADFKAAEAISQLLAGTSERPPSDDGVVLGVPAISQDVDRGLVYSDLQRFTGQQYGVNLTAVSAGSLQLRYGVNNATNAALQVLLRKYKPV